MRDKKQIIIKDLTITIISLILAITSFSMISKLSIDSSTEAFLPPQSESVLITNEIEKEFGSLDVIILGVMNENNSILNSNSLALIESLTKEIETLESVNSVMSLTNIDHISEDDYGIKVIPLYNGTKDVDIIDLKNKLDSWSDVYENTLISEDYSTSSIVITMDKNLDYSHQKYIIDSIGKITRESSLNGESFIFIGLPVIKNQINESLVSDMIILSPLVALLIIIVLSLTLKKLSAVILPIITIFISASYVVAIMIIFNITFTMATMLVPVLLLIVSSAYAIHVITHFYDRVLEEKGDVSFIQIDNIIKLVIKKNRRPIMLSGITTAAGFLAQLSSPLSPFRIFGILSAIGLIISQFASLILLPSFLRLTYRSGIKREVIHAWKKKDDKGFTKVISFYVSTLIIDHKKICISISLLLIILSIILVPNIKSGTNMISFFKKNSQIVQDTNTYNEKMGGSNLINIMISKKDGSRILNPTFLQALDNYNFEINKFSQVGKVETIVPYIKKMNYLLNKNTIAYQSDKNDFDEIDFFSDSFSFEEVEDKELNIQKDLKRFVNDEDTFNEIPQDPFKYGLDSEEDLTNLITQYLVLYSGNLEFLINDDLEADKTNISIMLKKSDNKTISEIIDFSNQYWKYYNDYNISIGGGETISLALSKLVTKSQIYSLVFSLLIVFILISFFFKSIKRGLIGLIPVVFALMGIFLSMSLLKITLDVVTSLLASLAIGIGVDYGIHYISSYQRIKNKTNIKLLINTIMNTTGGAIIINMLSITLGFSGLTFSQFIPVKQMGFLFCISMLASGISSITILPMVLILIDKKRGKGYENKQHKE